MANPLACRVACVSMDLLKIGAWQQQVDNIEAQLREELAPCRDAAQQVADVRRKDAIGVVGTREAVVVRPVRPLCEQRSLYPTLWKPSVRDAALHHLL